MDKLEKVIKAWECCNPLNRRCFECPYDDDCFHDSFDRVAIADMVKLLKEQKNLIDCLVEDQVKKIDEMDELLKEQQEKIDGLLEDLATAIDDKESALLMLKDQQAEIERLKAEKNRVIEQIESEIHRLFNERGCVKDDVGIAQYQWLINGYQSALDMIKDGEHE